MRARGGGVGPRAMAAGEVPARRAAAGERRRQCSRRRSCVGGCWRRAVRPAGRLAGAAGEPWSSGRRAAAIRRALAPHCPARRRPIPGCVDRRLPGLL